MMGRAGITRSRQVQKQSIKIKTTLYDIITVCLSRGLVDMNEKAYIYALVTSVRYDISRGMKKEEILRALSNVISRELLIKVIDKL